MILRRLSWFADQLMFYLHGDRGVASSIYILYENKFILGSMEQTYDPQKTFDVPPLKFIATKGCTIVSNLLLADTDTHGM